MPINFPLSPSVNQTYTYNGRTWIYNGNAWSVANTYSSNVATTQYVDTAIASVGSPQPGGSNTQVQFNDAGVFAGNAGLTYAKTTGTLTAKTCTSSEPINDNSRNITSNVTITTTYNAYSAGPITINDGVVVTINDGAYWSVV